VFPKIAIIHTDTLAAIGMKQILQDVMPIVVVDTFRSVGELKASGDVDIYYHYFAEAQAVIEDSDFFDKRRRKTIILNTAADTKQTLYGYNSLCTSLPEKQLIKSLLALEQTAHAEGRNLPHAHGEHAEKQLSVREVEVMTLIVRGYINKEIADRLNISLSTVITHRKNIMYKLGLKSVSALTIYAVTRGFVNINDI
jgi:DNA-binding CsgD family transcriptional regulator